MPLNRGSGKTINSLDYSPKGIYIQGMAEIKSALEIALARTEGMEVDKDKVREKEMKISGRKTARSYLEGNSDIKSLTKAYKQEKGDLRKAFTAGAAETLMSVLTLPNDSSYKDAFLKAGEGLGVLSDSPKDIEEMFTQLIQFFDQYLQNREQMEQQLTSQFQPLLKQKEEAIFAQTGSRIRINPMDDPDFQKAFSQNIGNLVKRYQEALEQAKGQLKSFLGLE